jgi:hypothetical protein
MSAGLGFTVTRSLAGETLLGYSRMNEKEIREGIRLLSEHSSYHFVLVINDRRAYCSGILTAQPVGLGLSL